MSHSKLYFVRNVSGNKSVRVAPVGFSWTTLFFGFWVPIFRKDWKWAMIMFGLVFFSAILCFSNDANPLGVLLGLSSWVFPFFYNKLYIKDLIADGYEIETHTGEEFHLIKLDLNIELPLVTK